jgi:chromosome segregation ATPase
MKLFSNKTKTTDTKELQDKINECENKILELQKIQKEMQTKINLYELRDVNSKKLISDQEVKIQEMESRFKSVLEYRTEAMDYIENLKNTILELMKSIEKNNLEMECSMVEYDTICSKAFSQQKSIVDQVKLKNMQCLKELQNIYPIL